jgi:UDP-N-acetylmuramoyl-L-alanyl-D-glutamate--2,6-diaminopimelate ligase
MLLHALLSRFDPRLSLAGIPNVEVRGVREDSRLVQPGDLFIARPGLKANGAKFIEDAKSRGAVAVVAQDVSPAGPLPVVAVTDVVAAASVLSNLFHEKPSGAVKLLGVTGTNGKTTVTYLVRHLLATHDRKCGIIGTVEIDDGRSRTEARMTTPGGCEVGELLAAMRDNGCAACAIEVSSHALDQSRVAGVNFAGAAFTNLTGDHLDYHITMEAYAGAKARLFASLDPSAVAAVNDDDRWANRMVEACAARAVRFGFGKSADYRAADARFSSAGSAFTLHTPGGSAGVELPMIGQHNVENALAAAALAGETFGMTAEQIAAGLRDAQGAPGRLQAVRAGQPFAVLVDYAHTDDALDNVLRALRPLCRGTLRVLFGCGGDRDRTKRPRMARTAERYAGAVYVTSDNPRTEDPQSILDEIATGFSAEGKRAASFDIDRRAAIGRVLADARPGDVVLIAGKGHENYQEVNGQRHRFDDVEEATAALRALPAAAA